MYFFACQAERRANSNSTCQRKLLRLIPKVPKDTAIPASTEESWPHFPSENPSTDEHREWCDAWKAALRTGNFLHITTEHPPRASEYRHRAAIPVPALVAGPPGNQALVNTLEAKNAQAIVDNAQRDLEWVEHLFLFRSSSPVIRCVSHARRKVSFN